MDKLITIDGPGGSGKGTVAKILAAKLGWNILDSGALYRLIALISENIKKTDPDSIGKELKDKSIFFELVKDQYHLFFDGKDVTNFIRREEIGVKASDLAHNQNIRNLIKDTQRSFYDPNIGLIADGRDMGSVVFPEAGIKIYLDASIEERAKRRQIQLKEKGMEVNMRNLISSLEDRDLKDKNRDVSPLLIPQGAKVIDSTNLSIDEVVNKIMDLI
jgi:cytidylate kinase|tara:strand:- start:411 stop:1061 length:651 start_codon:yes stop_codon:yes gene_type:complete